MATAMRLDAHVRLWRRRKRLIKLIVEGFSRALDEMAPSERAKALAKLEEIFEERRYRRRGH